MIEDGEQGREEVVMEDSEVVKEINAVRLIAARLLTPSGSGCSFLTKEIADKDMKSAEIEMLYRTDERCRYWLREGFRLKREKALKSFELQRLKMLAAFEEEEKEQQKRQMKHFQGLQVTDA